MLFSVSLRWRCQRKLFPADRLDCEVPLCIKVVEDREPKPVRECELVAWDVNCQIILVDIESDLQDKCKSQKVSAKVPSSPSLPQHCCATLHLAR